jgi:hypothetical protein
MAKSQNNVITHGLSGKIGDLLVFSQRGGKTIVSAVSGKPRKQSDIPNTRTLPSQKSTRIDVEFIKNNKHKKTDFFDAATRFLKKTPVDDKELIAITRRFFNLAQDIDI